MSRISQKRTGIIMIALAMLWLLGATWYQSGYFGRAIISLFLWFSLMFGGFLLYLAGEDKK